MFAGTLVPDEPAYRNPGLSQAGNRTQAGFVDGLLRAGVELDLVLSCRPVPAFPTDRRLWIGGETRAWQGACRLAILPTCNLIFGKQLLWSLAGLVRTVRWSLRHRGQRRVMFCYNLGIPPSSRLAARLTGTRIVSILYDAGQLSSLQDTLRARIREKLLARSYARFIRRLDGRVTITEAVAADFAPGQHFLLVDGGIEGVPPAAAMPRAEDGTVTFLSAGTLWEINGIPLLLDAMRLIRDEHVRLQVAGDGELRERVVAAARTDPRIAYLGRLAPEALQAAYGRADALLNIRLTSGAHASPYLFPSKLLECLAAGKVVLSTAVAHARRDYGAVARFLEAETPSALAAAMLAVAATPAAERRREGAAARDFVLANRTWEIQGRRLAQYVEEHVLGSVRKEEITCKTNAC